MDEKSIPFTVPLIVMVFVVIGGATYWSTKRNDDGTMPWYGTAGLILFVCSLIMFILTLWAYIRGIKVNQDVKLMETWSYWTEGISKLNPMTAKIFLAMAMPTAIIETPSLPAGTRGNLIQGTWVDTKFAFRYLAPVRDGAELPIHGRENRKQREAIIAELAMIGAVQAATPGRAAIMMDREKAVLHLREIFQ